jgi:hypothetical protein
MRKGIHDPREQRQVHIFINAGRQPIAGDGPHVPKVRRQVCLEGPVSQMPAAGAARDKG